MLGTGNCLVWFGILRYLGFFRTYNVLILTMKGAAPNMFRFLICSSFLYVGFSFAGWVILGKKIKIFLLIRWLTYFCSRSVSLQV